MRKYFLCLLLFVFCFSVIAKPIFRVPFLAGNYTVTTGFNDPGSKYHSDAYNGYYALDMISLVNNVDLPVVAAAEGIVADAGWSSGGGYYVIINHGDGYTTKYLHMRDAPLVKKGDIVIPGEKLGIMGDTGSNSRGAHLHWQAYYNDNCYSYIPESNLLPLTSGKYKDLRDVVCGSKLVSDNYPLIYKHPTYGFNFTNQSPEGWGLGNVDVSSPGVCNNTTGYGMDNGSWFVKVNGSNPGILSPEFTKTLMARSTVMQFSAKVNVDVNPAQIGRIWVKDQTGSWNNPVAVKLFNYAYNYNNGVFKQNDYNVYYVDFYNVRTPENEAQYGGELQIKQFSIELTKALNNSSEYWAVDWVKIYTKNGDGEVYLATTGGTVVTGTSSSAGTLSGGSSGSSGSSGSQPPSPSVPRYQYSGAWLCQGVADGTIQWSKVPVNPKAEFNQGEDLSCLAEFKNISVNHRLKVDIYKDSVYSWTWGGTAWNNVGAYTMGYSYAQATNANAEPGNYEFRIFIDTGDGFKQIDTKSCKVLSTQPRFIYSGAWVCESIADGPAQWSKMAVNARTTYKQGDNVSLLVEYKNIKVNHCQKVEIYRNGEYSWTYGGTVWADVGQWGWGYSYATPTCGNCLPGDYEFRVFIDTGNGFVRMDSKTFTVLSASLNYSYVDSWTCEGIADGTIAWSKVPVNAKFDFIQGQNICFLGVVKDIKVNHRFKVDIFYNGSYSWTWGGVTWADVGQWGWGFSYASPVQGNVQAGSYEFKFYIDTGSGYQLLSSKIANVSSN